MVPYGSTNNSLTTAQKGYKLGTTSATWHKIKLAASGGAVPADSATPAVSGDVSPPYDDSEEPLTIVDAGPGGEIVIVYPWTDILEVWKWHPLAQGAVNSKNFNSDVLYLHHQQTILCEKKSGPIESFRVLLALSSDRYLSYVLAAKDTNGMPFVEYHSRSYSNFSQVLRQHITLPDVFQKTQLSIKANKHYLVVASDNGFVYLRKYNDKTTGFDPVNFDYNSQKFKNESCQPILAEYRLDLADHEILLKTSTFDGTPIFDLVGTWLVYSPTKAEYKHMKRSANQKILAKNSSPRTQFTPVKLPPAGPLLNRVVSAVSSSALDSLFKLSELSSRKIKSYMSKESRAKKIEKEVVISLHSVSSQIGKILYSTATTIQKSTQHDNNIDNELIKIVDLSTGKTMAIFKPPAGVSYVSLSPYDLQLVHASLRGDHFYMWDLYKLPSDVSLIGKFVRGKTSATVKEIFWFINLNNESIKGNNSGFGCITKKSGSVHWYNINYLSGGDSSKNYPNILGDVYEDISSDDFLDSWILSSLHANKFVALPASSNFFGNTSGSSGKMRGSLRSSSSGSNSATDSLHKMNQLAVVDHKNRLKLLSPLNGHHVYMYELPVVKVDKQFIPICEATTDAVAKEKAAEINPLSQTEIETCSPYLNLVNNKNIEFAVYDFENDDDSACFAKTFEEFGKPIPLKALDFGKREMDSTRLSDSESNEDTLIARLNEGLVIDQGDLLVNGEEAS